MKLCIAIFLAAILAACATGGSPQAAAGVSVQALTTAYVAAGEAELVYLKLPTCGTPGATAICATPEMRAKVKAADQAVYNALVAARAAEGTANASAAATAAQQSLAGFTAITSTLPK